MIIEIKEAKHPKLRPGTRCVCVWRRVTARSAEDSCMAVCRPMSTAFTTYCRFRHAANVREEADLSAWHRHASPWAAETSSFKIPQLWWGCSPAQAERSCRSCFWRAFMLLRRARRRLSWPSISSLTTGWDRQGTGQPAARGQAVRHRANAESVRPDCDDR